MCYDHCQVAEETWHHSKKKTCLYREADESKRSAYLDALSQIEESDRVYLDESAVAQQGYEYGWCKKGERCVGLTSGGKRAKVNVIGALHQGRLLGLRSFERNCDGDYFCHWLEHHLLPLLKQGKTLIMDNARFHHVKEVCRVIEAAGCRVLYLSPYSPDLNPIEHYWFALKNHARRILRDEAVSLRQAVKAAIEYMNLF